MKRRVIAAVSIAGATVPLLAATLFLAGCCALPFHDVLHELLPLCDMASMMRADHAEGEREAIPPAREKEPVTRIVTVAPQPFRLAAADAASRALAPASATAYRSFISLGAARCDRDVGLHVLVETFLI